MHKKIPAILAVACGALLGACSDGSSPSAEETRVLAALQEQLGNMMTDSSFGADGAVESSPAAAANLAALALGPAVDTVAPPRFWGRLRVVPGGPGPVVERHVVVSGDTATVDVTVSFEGVFLLDTTPDTTFNPTSKPLAERASQRAVLVRDDAARHGWRPVLLSPRVWRPTAPERRTVAVTAIRVYVNATLFVDVANPDSLYEVNRHIPRIHVGDTVRVVARVTNDADTAYVPNTFVFLHVRHEDADAVRWHRGRMRDNGDGTYERRWVARRTGIDRFVVDAIDAATLVLGTADNYRANEVAIPYRIE